MKKLAIKVISGFLLLGAFAFMACNDLFSPPGAAPVIPPGKGLVNVSLDVGGDLAKKILPNADFDLYEFTFIKQGAGGGALAPVDKPAGQSSLSFSLEPGDYTLSVKAYKGEKSDATLSGSGVSDVFAVTANQSVAVSIPLSGITTGTGNRGTFTLTIKYPYKVSVDTAALGSNNLKTDAEITFAAATGISTMKKTLELAVGNYVFSLSLTLADGSKAGDADFVVISKGLTSAYTYDFTSADFKSENAGTALASGESWHGFVMNQTGSGVNPQAIRYDSFKDKSGTVYQDVLKVVAPAAGYTGATGYAMRYTAANVNGPVTVSAQVWVDKTVPEDVYFYWRGTGSGNPSDAAAFAAPLAPEQFGKWITVVQNFTAASSMQFALMGSNSTTASSSKGLKHATIYIRDFRLSVNNAAVEGAAVDVSSVSLSHTGTLTLEADNTLQLSATALPANASNKSLAWTSSNTGAATVSASGLVTPVTGGGGQSTIIRAVSHNDKSASVTLNIVPATGVKISITSLADPITIGDKKQLTVSAQSGSYDNILWSSSNTNLVRVDANGVARAVGYTSSTVGATESASGSHTGKINIYNGTGTAVITAVARDASNKEVARASVNVNTTTAAQTAYNSGSNAQNYFNFGAKFADKFLMGQTAGAATNAQLANMGFTVVTPGAGMKPQDHLGNNVRFSNGVKNSSNATWYSFNSTNGVKLHGHVLLWHQWNSIGQWFKDVGLQGKEVSQNGTAEAKQAYRDEAILNLEAYIKYIVEHYNSSTASWDVVNEAFTGNHSNKHWSEPASGTPGWWRYLRQDDETSDAALHPAPWWWAIGPEYVWYAFLFARQYTTEGTTLYYNDYGMDEDLSKVTQVIAMMNDLNARYETYKADHPGAKPGKLIDGVGMQQHLNRASNPDNVKTALDRYRTAGVKVVISELTVLPYNYSTEYHANRFYDSSGNAYCHFEKLPNYSGHDASEPGVLSARYQMDQALMYARAMRIYADYADVIDRVSIFGLNSGIGSWRPFSLPFDNSSRAKPAVYAIMNYADFTEDHPSGSLSAQWPVNSVTGY